MPRRPVHDAAKRVELGRVLSGDSGVLRGTLGVLTGYSRGTHGVPFGDVGEAAAGVFPRRLIRARRLGPAHGRHLVLKYGVLRGVIHGYSRSTTRGTLGGTQWSMGTPRVPPGLEGMHGYRKGWSRGANGALNRSSTPTVLTGVLIGVLTGVLTRVLTGVLTWVLTGVLTRVLRILVGYSAGTDSLTHGEAAGHVGKNLSMHLSSTGGAPAVP